LLQVAIIEDIREIREGLSILIGGTPGFAVTALYATMEEAIPAIEAAPPRIALVDIGLPGMSGIEGIAILKRSLAESFRAEGLAERRAADAELEFDALGLEKLAGEGAHARDQVLDASRGGIRRPHQVTDRV
jgi:DNA-binding response OmpR family regulator